MSDSTHWSNDELEDREFPDEADADVDHDYGDDSVDTIECAECGHEVYEEAEQCPHCGHYLTAHTSFWSGKPWWWILMGLLGIGAMLFTMVQF